MRYITKTSVQAARVTLADLAKGEFAVVTASEHGGFATGDVVLRVYQDPDDKQYPFVNITRRPETKYALYMGSQVTIQKLTSGDTITITVP